MSLYKNLLRNPLVSTISNHIDGYPTPINLTYLWGFGSLAGLALVIQIVTGVLLAMHYAAEIHLAFTSVEHIMRDVRGGVALRYIHANGASMFFILVYVHMFRGLYYGSYFQPRSNLWYSGVVIFVLMMATAFMGYVLPWGQMSFWGATVITNLFSAIPGIGDSIVQLLWGGFSVDNPTLNRFFSLHYFVPFIIAAAAGLHLILLHQPGSNNPLGISSVYDRVPFYPYFYVKDLFGFFIFVTIFSLFVIYAPNYLGHPDNYIEANPLVTPAHIVPEWYFLPFYAVLRTIPDKLGGVVLMGLAIAVLAVLPLVDTSSFRSNFFKPLNIWLFWFFFADSICLGWIGQEIVESPFIEMANFVTLSYFLYFMPLLPIAGFLENAVIRHELKHASLILPLFFLPFAGYSFEMVLSINDIVQGYDVNWNFFTSIPLLQIISLSLFLLFLGIFFPKTGEFIRFFNKVSFAYLIFILWRFAGDIVLPGDSLFANIFFIYATAMVAIFLYGISDRFFVKENREIEFPILVFFTYLGAVFLFVIHSFVDFMLAIETVTLASYALAAYERKNRFSTYAGVQYFILGSIPSGMLILGTSFLYKNWGTLFIEDLDLLLTQMNAPSVSASSVHMNTSPILSEMLGEVNTKGIFVTEFSAGVNELYNTGNLFANLSTYSDQEWESIFSAVSPQTFGTIIAMILILFNLLFKITAAPFHFWAPSIYGKAPLPSVTFLSIFSKGMIFFILFKLVFTIFYSFRLIVIPFLLFCGVLSVLFGMIGAFAEKMIKKFFVYSSMGHVGFMLAALSVSTLEGSSATFHYLPVYIITSFLMWFILLHMGRETHYLTQFNTLKNSDPILAMVFALLIFSMSGIPPLGGFFVKLDVLAALLDNSRFYTNFILLFFTVASFFYYLRVVKIIFFDESKVYIHRQFATQERLWIIAVIFLVLLFYILIVQKPLLAIQTEALAALF